MIFLMIGADASHSIVGDNVVALVRIVPSDVGGVPSSLEPIGDRMLYYSGMAPGSPPSTFCADRVWGSHEYGSTHADLLSRILPSALSVLDGVSTAVFHVHCRASVKKPTSDADFSQSFFDSRSQKCIAQAVLERLVEGASRLGLPSYLGIGAIGGTDPEPAIYDILGSDPNAVKPSQVAFSPSLVNDSLFADFKEANVSYGRRCAELFCEGQRRIASFQGRYAIPKHCTLFATLSIPVGFDLQTVRTFTILDVCDASAARSVLSVCPSITDPYLNCDALSLLTFGLRLCNKVTVIASIPENPGPDSLECLSAVVAARSIVTAPRRMSDNTVLSEQSLPFDPRDDESESKLFLESTELMTLRSMLSTLSLEQRAQTVLFQQLQQDYGHLVACLQKTQEQITSVLPDVLPELHADANISRILSSRFGAIREMEQAQERERRRLSTWQSSLANLPIRREAGLSTLDSESRTLLLETTIKSLNEEIYRLRSLFERDVRLLRVELDSEKSRVASSAGPTSSFSRANPLQPLISAFSDECGLLIQKTGTSHSLPQLHEMIDALCAGLKSGVDILFCEGGVEGKAPTPLECMSQMGSFLSDESLFVQMALDKSRRAMGIPLPPPSASSLAPSSAAYWRAMVEERASCRSERWALQHLSKGMALTSARLLEGLSDVEVSLNALGEELNSAGGFSMGGSTKAQQTIDRLLNQRDRDVRSFECGSLKMKLTSLQTSWGHMALQIRRCGELCRLLHDSQASARLGAVAPSFAATPLGYELDADVREALGLVPTANEKRTVLPAAHEEVSVSIDGILKGEYKVGVPAANSTPRVGKSSRIVTPGFFSEISRK